MSIPRWYRVLKLTRLVLVVCAMELAVADSLKAMVFGDIMPLGDSITQGFPVPGGYRDLLFTLLEGTPPDGDDHTFSFVGRQNDNCTTNLMPNQCSHEGHIGDRTDEIDAKLGAIFGINLPDIILLMIGTNDMCQDFFISTAHERLGTLLTKIDSLAPDARTIVASITPGKAVPPGQPCSTLGLVGSIVEYNAKIPKIVAEHQMEFLDLHSLLTEDDLFDAVHPNSGGYDIMAEAWYLAIIPEPSTVLLLATGLVGMAVGSRRRPRA